MALPNGKLDREYEFFKDSELFNTFTVGPTAGSIVLNSPTPKVGDLLILNTGSTDVRYNLGVSGGGVVVSTSGVTLIAGCERTYNDVGFDVIALIASTTGSSVIQVHKIYSER